MSAGLPGRYLGTLEFHTQAQDPVRLDVFAVKGMDVDEYARRLIEVAERRGWRRRPPRLNPANWVIIS